MKKIKKTVAVLALSAVTAMTAMFMGCSFVDKIKDEIDHHFGGTSETETTACVEHTDDDGDYSCDECGKITVFDHNFEVVPFYTSALAGRYFRVYENGSLTIHHGVTFTYNSETDSACVSCSDCSGVGVLTLTGVVSRVGYSDELSLGYADWYVSENATAVCSTCAISDCFSSVSYDSATSVDFLTIVE